MKKLDLNAYGVTKMNAMEMNTVNGGVGNFQTTAPAAPLPIDNDFSIKI